MVLIPEKAVLLTPLKTNWPFWPYHGQIWPNMGLSTVLGKDNFTSQFYVTRVAIPEKAVLFTPLKTKWPYYKSSITDVAHEKITVLATFLPNMNCP